MINSLTIIRKNRVKDILIDILFKKIYKIKNIKFLIKSSIKYERIHLYNGKVGYKICNHRFIFETQVIPHLNKTYDVLLCFWEV